MEKLMLIIAIISSLYYGWNVLSDSINNKKINSTHIGYSSISILSWWYIVPEISFGLACLVIPYTLIILISKIN